MGKLRWYKRDPDAALAGMIGMTLQERGAYNTILDLLYSRDGILPDNDDHLRAAMGCHGNEWRAVKKKLIHRGKIWITPEGNLMAKRVETALKEAGNFSETQRNRVKKRWENSKISKENNAEVIPSLVIPIQPQPQPEKKETPVNTDTESLIDKSLPLAVDKKINGFHNGGNGSALKQQKADQFVQQRCAEALGENGWMIVFAAEDEKSPEHSKAVSLMLKTSKRLKLGWISPEEKRRRAQA